LIPQQLRPPVQITYYKLFSFYLHLQFWFADRLPAFRPEHPMPPAILRYRVSELVSVNEFLRIGEGCAQLIRLRAGTMGIDFTAGRRVLDFGCGCGRTIRWLLDDGAEFHGADVDAVAIDWCKKHLVRAHFLANTPAPPLPYPGEWFDAVYCLSVFTHLDEPMQDAWLRELSRILKPGGVLLFTIFGSVARKGLDEQGQETLDRRGFVHRRSQKLRWLVPDWYQTTWHSREYILGRLATWFEDVRYFEVPDGMQDVVAARKPR
jgi:SAM-dependent methyltransferase